MPLDDVRSVYFPYCIKRQPDGRFVVLNREYKPVGFYSEGFIRYEDYPVAAPIKGITKSMATKLSHCGDPSIECIYLYDDGCTPTRSTANMAAYLSRLQLLAKLKITAD